MPALPLGVKLAARLGKRSLILTSAVFASELIGFTKHADRAFEESWEGVRQIQRFQTMKPQFAMIAILLGGASAAFAAAPAPPTSLRAIHTLTNAEARQGLPVAFEATVTYYRGSEHTLFVQDGDTGIYVYASPDANLVPGDRVLVRGKTHESFNPFVIPASIVLLRHGVLPKPAPANFGQMVAARTDCQMVSVRGVVRSADYMPQTRVSFLDVLTDGGYFQVTLDGGDAGTIENLLDAEVELTGVAGETFDSKLQVTGILLHIQSPAGIKILKPPAGSPWALSVTPMDRVLAVYHVNDSTPRVRVHGTITYYEPGAAVMLQDGARSIWIETQTRSPLHVGDVADAVGFPQTRNGFLNLVHGEVHDSLKPAPVAPLPATWDSLTPHGNDSPGHHYELVSIEGQVVTQVQEAAQDEYVLSTGGKQFSAIYRHLDGPPKVNKRIPLGSRVRVTGICVLENSNPFLAEVPFSILMRSPADIVIVARPSPVNVRNLIFVVGMLLLVLMVGGFRSWSIERRVRRQTAALAALEHQRSQILEDINGSRPLAEIIEQIAAMVSLKLRGAPCWCQISEGARLGSCPPEGAALRLIQEEIPARSGPALGTIHAGLDPLTKPSPDEAGALSMGAELATLAIETRRLFSDLLHRSEFDLLTDIHNRFFMDQYLEIQIEEARRRANIFGLIYIDLDRFKQINDLHGHQAGDLYLQEAAERMKQQLRPHDLLARVGGDEFAVLVPVVRNRAEVEEIAHRLEHCFDRPFAIEGIVLHGATSVGVAMYPEDGTTKDSLLSSADAAMYVEKNAKRLVLANQQHLSR